DQQSKNAARCHTSYAANDQRCGSEETDDEQERTGNASYHRYEAAAYSRGPEEVALTYTYISISSLRFKRFWVLTMETRRILISLRKCEQLRLPEEATEKSQACGCSGAAGILEFRWIIDWVFGRIIAPKAIG